MQTSYLLAGWTSVIFGSLAPAYFYLGYRPLDFEVAVLLGASAVAAACVLVVASLPKAQSIFLIVVIVIYVLVYFVNVPLSLGRIMR
jgi:hypothetical protein